MSTRLAQSWLRLLCLLPFLVSALLPVGMMPSISADGSFTLIICTADGPQERSFPAGDEQHESASSWCPFSQISASALATAPVGWTYAPFSKIANFVVATRDAPTHLESKSPKPRGPPTIL